MQTLAAFKIAHYRADHGLTLKQFGQRFGAGEQTARGWEQLGKKPRDPVLIALWKAGIARPEDWFIAAPAHCASGAQQEAA